MPASRKPRSVKMSVGLAVRCAAMDCEAGNPQAAMLVWQDEKGRLHKRVFPGSQLTEDALFGQLERIPPGSTKPEGIVA